MKIEPKYKAFIFDMDGTLVNSEPVGPKTFVQIAKKNGSEPDDDEYDTFVQSWKRIGNYIDEKKVLSDFVKRHDLDIEPDEFVNEFFQTYLVNLTKTPALTGVDNFLHRAKQNGYKMVIVSASKTAQIETVLKNHNWQDLFDFIVGEEDITKHKPDPEGYLKAIERIDLPASDCVIFEDAKNGAIAAQATGAFVIGMREGNAETVDLSAASLVLNNFSEIEL